MPTEPRSTLWRAACLVHVVPALGGAWGIVKFYPRLTAWLAMDSNTWIITAGFALLGYCVVLIAAGAPQRIPRPLATLVLVVDIATAIGLTTLWLQPGLPDEPRARIAYVVVAYWLLIGLKAFAYPRGLATRGAAG